MREAITYQKEPTADLPSLLRSTFDRRTDSSTPIGPRSPAVTALWCAPGGQTWIILELTAPVAANIVMPMILQARAAILLRITQVGDAVFPGGLFSWLGGNGHVLRTQNSNNHQMTYGVVAAALTAVIDYMQTENAFGVGSFTIYDGANEVAKGTIT